MIKYKLKPEVTEEQLKKVGFRIEMNPLTRSTFAIRSTVPNDTETIIIQLEPPYREVAWRFVAMEGKPLGPKLADIIDLFITDAKPDRFESTEKQPKHIGINDLAHEIHLNAVAHGWWEEKRPLGDIISLIHTEISEAYEEFRDGKPLVYEGEHGKPEGIAVELVDGIIRILDYLDNEGVDTEKLILLKHEYNKTRPYRHGGKKA